MTHNHLVPGSSPGGTTLKTPLLEGFFVFQHVKFLLGINMGIKSISFVPRNKGQKTIDIKNNSSGSYLIITLYFYIASRTLNAYQPTDSLHGGLECGLLNQKIEYSISFLSCILLILNI